MELGIIASEEVLHTAQIFKTETSSSYTVLCDFQDRPSPTFGGRGSYLSAKK